MRLRKEAGVARTVMREKEWESPGHRSEGVRALGQPGQVLAATAGAALYVVHRTPYCIPSEQGPTWAAQSFRHHKGSIFSSK